MNRYADLVEIHTLKEEGILWTAKTDLENVVTCSGSFYVPVDYAAGEDSTVDILSGLLEAGTSRKDKYVISEFIADRGAEFSITFATGRLGFRIRSHKKHVPDLIHLAGELFSDPLLSQSEFDLALAQAKSALTRQATRTSVLAAIGLRAKLFPRDSPSFGFSIEEQHAHYEDISYATIRECHERLVKRRDFRVVAVGDVDPPSIRNAVEAAFSQVSSETYHPQSFTNSPVRATEDIIRRVPGKINVDVRAGHALQLRRGDEEFLALYVATQALGGNFSSLLMDRLRNSLGLTYSISASIADISINRDGFLDIVTAFTDDNVSSGVDALRETFAKFCADGVTEDALEVQQTMLVGLFAVGLSTSSGLAASLLANSVRGFGPGYLDEFPRLVQELEAREVNDAIARHYKPDYLQVSIAGEVG